MDDLNRQIIELKARRDQIAEKNFRGVLSDTLAKELLDKNEKKESELTLELHSYQNNQEDIMKIVRHSLSILEDIGSAWLRVDLQVKKRFQKFLFPQGLPFNGDNFGTPILAYCIKPKWSITPQKSLIVPARIRTF
ncbi:MAG: Site-specific recombinase [Microgenomates group bacterium Gr01-1014_7]|nr:MAG: Site-specific recombinase [Microgenomates group bacterium Gr01-1014_7]